MFGNIGTVVAHAPEGPTETRVPAVRAVPVEAGLAAARAVLAKAELAAGLRTRLTGPGLGGATEGIHLPAGLDSLFPAGFAPGSIVSVRGSASLLHTLAAASMGETGWAAVVGGRDIGWLAAAEAGVDLTRVVNIPKPGPAIADVVAACTDGFSVVVLGNADLGAGAARSLTGRVRSNGTVLLTTGEWHGATTLRARVRGAEIGPDGLTERVITVTRDGMPATVVLRMGATPSADQQTGSTTARRHLQAVS
ncbi:MAG TPA: hypothetical protein VFC82_03055 [Actinomycetaceae bacterium]|nr:hypothetical protein [Actinomycetaceae bacterium]